MAESIVSETIVMLGQLLIDEASFLSGVKNQVRDLQSELQRMQCFLKDADKRRHESESVRNLIKDIRNLAYRTENVVEAFSIKVESKEGNGIKKSLRRFSCIFDFHKFGSEIANITTEIAHITRSLQTYGIQSEKVGQCSDAATKNFLRQTFAHEIEEHFVGMQNDLERLVSLVMDRETDHIIISIYGMGGSGKTTLAKQVFNHIDVQYHFQSFAWVVVSQQFDAESLLGEILRQLDPSRDKDDIKKMEYTQLVQELCRTQSARKCLVVLDDIWKKEDLIVLSHAFPTTAVDCKVLLTTRKQGVAEMGIPHKLNVFSEEEAWELLKKKALTSTNARGSYAQEEQEKLGKQMVGKCGCLPLAISVIGGILRKKETLEEWEMVNRDMDLYLRFGEGIEENNQIMQILALSYEDLPHQLKPCFLYFAYYPEDAVIDVQVLYWMWIAEGMISLKDQQNKTLMEIAERYLTELASRSLVQLQLFQSSTTAKYISCHLHDLMRDLCLMRCQEEEFLKVLDFRGRQQLICGDLSRYHEGNAYRLAISGEVDDNIVGGKILKGANANTRLYSLSYFGSGKQIAHKVPKTLERLRFLRVLAFQGLELSNTKLLGKVIKKLIHLRFLGFIRCKLDEVPSSVATLPYLQTFCLRVAVGVKMPNVLWKLKRLVHLYLQGYIYVDQGTLRLDGLCGLEMLSCSSYPIQVAEECLPKLTNLRIFRYNVRDNETLSLIITCIEVHWCCIQDIVLGITGNCDFISTRDGPMLLYKLFMCRALNQLIIRVPIRELPKYEPGMLASCDLVSLELLGSFIQVDPMPMLEKLPKLRTLKLHDESFGGEELICSSFGFPQLTDLSISGLPTLRRWRIDGGAMPKLTGVELWNCPELEMLPDGMEFLTTLRKLTMGLMHPKFVERIYSTDGKKGPDFYKIQHVPLVNLRSNPFRGLSNSSTIYGDLFSFGL